MSDTPIADALRKVDIPDLDQSITLAAEATGHDIGVSLEAERDFGKPGGWSAGAQGAWWKSAGATVKGWIRWRPTPR